MAKKNVMNDMRITDAGQAKVTVKGTTLMEKDISL